MASRGWRRCPAARQGYTDKNDITQAFVVIQANGRWGDAEEVPGTGSLNKGPNSLGTLSVSCPSPRSCSAAGMYEDGEGAPHPFVASEVNGGWGTAKTVPGTIGGSYLDTVSCASPARCGAGGELYVGAARWQAFVVTETGGTPGRAEQVPGVAALNKAGFATVTGVTCASPGNCAAAGYYDPSNSQPHAFVVSEVSGSWRRAAPVSGTVVHGKLSEIESISCGSPGSCSAGGWDLKNGVYGAFLISQPSKAVTATALNLSAATIAYGAESKERLSVAVTSQYAGSLAGTVTVRTVSGGVTICRITVRKGKGSCVLKNRQMRRGTYRLVAVYPGAAKFYGSASAHRTLKVVK